MSDTLVSLLTPPGTGAIATVEVRGPRAWELAKQLFKPAGKTLPESPEVSRFWFGTLGSDEVVLAVTEPLPCGRGSLGAAHNEPRPQGSAPSYTIEVHCHGGRRVVRWVIEQFTSHGCTEERTPLSSSRGPRLTCDRSLGWTREKGEGFELLQRAPTLRTAAVLLLDQLNGAFANEVRRLLALLDTAPTSAVEPLKKLAELGNTVGRHIVEPWKVVVAGPPNVGKSSLVNALAGYQRTVVSAVAGTTRDAIGVRVAFDGWPVELIDTAGLRQSEGLEAKGIERAKAEVEEADLGVWVIDASVSDPVFPTVTRGVVEGLLSTRWVWVKNKSDRSLWPDDFPLAEIPVSALRGDGISALATRIVSRLVPHAPAVGQAVPFTTQLADLIEAARSAMYYEKPQEAAWFLREALSLSE